MTASPWVPPDGGGRRAAPTPSTSPTRRPSRSGPSRAGRTPPARRPVSPAAARCQPPGRLRRPEVAVRPTRDPADAPRRAAAGDGDPAWAPGGPGLLGGPPPTMRFPAPPPRRGARLRRAGCGRPSPRSRWWSGWSVAPSAGWPTTPSPTTTRPPPAPPGADADEPVGQRSAARRQHLGERGRGAAAAEHRPGHRQLRRARRAAPPAPASSWTARATSSPTTTWSPTPPTTTGRS